MQRRPPSLPLSVPLSVRDPRWKDPRWRTTCLLNIAAIVERADEQILPAVFFYISRSLNATPSQLGTLTLCRALVQALSSPLSGLISDRVDRTKVVAAGCALWGVMTSAIGMCTNMHQAMLACAFNGLGLALVIPCLQSLTADLNPPDQRGVAFGVMFCTGSIGGMVGGFFATNISSTLPFGLDGWRVAFHSVAAVALLTTVAVLQWAIDPRPRAVISPLQLGDERRSGGAKYTAVPAASEGVSSKVSPAGSHQMQRTQSGGLRGNLPTVRRQPPDMWARIVDAMQDIRIVMNIATFRIIILQGIVGSLPWQAMVFYTLWLQLLGFSDFAAASLMATFAFGTSLGHLIGGAIGDRMVRRFPNAGRVATAQASVLMGLPLCWLLLRVLPSLPHPPSATWAFAAVLFISGTLITWPGPLNSAIMADVCPAPLRSTVYAFDRSFEGGVAACAAPLVGIIAERFFGFTGVVASGDPTSEGDFARLQNAKALGNSLLYCLIIPWIFCFFSYTGAHWYYQQDKAAANRFNKRESRGSEGDLVSLATHTSPIRRRPSEVLLAEQQAAPLPPLRGQPSLQDKKHAEV